MQQLIEKLWESIGGQLNQETMASLNHNQITLLAYDIMRREVMEGGFVQLLYNGYGPFLFNNPFVKVMRQWGQDDLARIINKAHKLYNRYREQLSADLTDEQFMALYEQMPEFDELDDDYIDNEHIYTAKLAEYVGQHMADFQAG